MDWDPRCCASGLRGEACLALGRWEEAVQHCDWALAHGHRSPELFATRGAAHRKLQQLKEAMADGDEAVHGGAYRDMIEI